MLFTDEPKDKVNGFFKSINVETYARSGSIATETFKIPKGPLPTEKFPGAIEAHLRKLGMPTQLKDAVIQLLSDFTVCVEGKPIDVDRAQILKLWDRKLSSFKMTPTCCWSKKGEEGVFSMMQ